MQKKAAKDNYREFIQNVDIQVYEELMLWGMILGYAKLSIEERKQELETFIPYINNWAICDCSCATYKFMRDFPEEWMPFIKAYLTSKQEYKLRFAVVCPFGIFLSMKLI